MSSRPLSRRSVLIGGGVAATLAAAALSGSWSTVAHDGEDHDATPDATPASTPAAGANDRQMMDGDSGVGGLYLTITNAGPEPDALLGGTTAVCQTVEPHAMRMDGDVMVMTYLPEGLPVPAAGSVTLAPDGDHVMLIGLVQDLRPDTTFTIALTFMRAGEMALTASVRWVLDPDEPEGLAAAVTAGDLTIETVWSRPAPMISAVAAPIDLPGTVAGRH